MSHQKTKQPPTALDVDLKSLNSHLFLVPYEVTYEVLNESHITNATDEMMSNEIQKILLKHRDLKLFDQNISKKLKLKPILPPKLVSDCKLYLSSIDTSVNTNTVNPTFVGQGPCKMKKFGKIIHAFKDFICAYMPAPPYCNLSQGEQPSTSILAVRLFCLKIALLDRQFLQILQSWVKSMTHGNFSGIFRLHCKESNTIVIAMKYPLLSSQN